MTFEELVAQRIGFDALVKLRDSGTVAEPELMRYCQFQDEYMARIVAGFKARGADLGSTVAEVFTEAELQTFWDGTLERFREGASLN